MTGDKYDWDRTYFEITMEKAASDDMFDYWECGVRPKYKRLSYGFRIHAGDETVYMVDSGIDGTILIRLQVTLNFRTYMKSMYSKYRNGPKKPCFIKL